MSTRRADEQGPVPGPVGPAPGSDAPVQAPFAAGRGAGAAAARLVGAAGAMQAGNRAVAGLIGATLQRDPAPPAAAPAGTSVTIGGTQVSTYEQARGAMGLGRLVAQDARKELEEDGRPAPEKLTLAIEEAEDWANAWVGKGTDPLDAHDAANLKGWYADCVAAVNEARAIQAREAADRAKAAAESAKEAAEALEKKMLPLLHDKQRAAFRADDEDGVLKTADTVATVVDTALVAKDAVTKTLEVASDLRSVAGRGGTSATFIAVSEKVPAVLEALEKLNKMYASLQLVRTGIDLAKGGRTDAEGGRKAVGAMSTVVSAGGTLLGASAGFTLYSNLYIGPMVEACLKGLAQIEDMRSKSVNRDLIQMGEFNTVNWSIEPGGRPMFDFMLAVMHADGPGGVPTPPAAVEKYMLKNDDLFSKSAGSKGEELPESGLIFKDLDQKKIKGWVFANRESLWASLYGDCQVPS